MTPLQLANSECANYEPDGGCAGVGIGAKLEPTPIGRKARCSLADNAPCRYFEECVLAGIPILRDETLANEWQEAADIYKERKREHERGLGKGSVERTEHDGTPGLRKETTPADDIGRRTSGGQTTGRLVRLSGRRRAQVARRPEIRSGRVVT